MQGNCKLRHAQQESAYGLHGGLKWQWQVSPIGRLPFHLLPCASRASSVRLPCGRLARLHAGDIVLTIGDAVVLSTDPAADAKKVCSQKHHLSGRSQSHAYGVAHLQINLEFANVFTM